MRVLILARVSGDQQEQEKTIQTQLKVCREKCEAEGWEIVDVIADESCRSEIPLEERAEASRVFPLIRKGEIGAVVVYTADRVSRLPHVFWPFHAHIRKHGVRFISATQPFDDTTDEGLLMLGMLLSVSTYDRSQIERKLLNGKLRILESTYTLDGEEFGFWPGGLVPYGYRAFTAARRTGILVDEEPLPGLEFSPADVIRMIFRWVVEDHLSLGKIADKLTVMGIPTHSYLPAALGRRDGESVGYPNCWKRGSVSAIIKNPVYYGVHTYGKRSDKNADRLTGSRRRVPGIIDKATCDLAQEILVSNKRLSKRNAKQNYLLRGLIKCGHCGFGYSGHPYWNRRGRHDERWSYYCTGARGHKAERDRQGLASCPSRSISHTLEQDVLDLIRKLIRDPHETVQQVRAGLTLSDASAAEITAEIAVLQQQAALQEKAKDRTLQLFQLDRIDLQKYDREVARLDAVLSTVNGQIEEKREKLQRAEAVETHQRNMLAFLETAQGVADDLENYTWEKKRRLVEIWIKQIQVRWEGKKWTAEIEAWVPESSEVVSTTSRRGGHNLMLTLQSRIG